MGGVSNPIFSANKEFNLKLEGEITKSGTDADMSECLSAKPGCPGPQGFNDAKSCEPCNVKRRQIYEDALEHCRSIIPAICTECHGSNATFQEDGEWTLCDPCGDAEAAPALRENPMRLRELVKTYHLYKGDSVWTTESKHDGDVFKSRQRGERGEITAITGRGKVKVRWAEGLHNISDSKIDRFQRNAAIAGRRRRVMGRLLYYENFYSSGAEGHPRYFN